MARLAARDYRVNDRGETKRVATVFVKDITEIGVSKEEATKRIEYWNGLEDNRKDGYLSQLGTEGDTAKDKLLDAIYMAWIQSPEMVAKRASDKAAYDNELLECSRTGEMVARKDGITAGNSFVALTALSDAEAEFLGIKKPVAENENWKLTEAYIKTGRKSYLSKRS